MTMTLMILIGLSVIAVIAAILISNNSGTANVPEPEEKSDDNGLGAPLFVVGPSDRKVLAHDLGVNDSVWALTPYGPQMLTVTMMLDGDQCVHLRNDLFAGEACFETDYFSPDMAQRYGGHTGVWRLSKIVKLSGGSPFDHYGDREKRANRDWLRDESVFGDDDLLDTLLFYYFIFDGFHEPFDYYDNYEMPAYEVPDDGRPPIDEQIFDDVAPAPDPEPMPVETETEPEPEPPPVVVEEIPDEPAEVTEDTNFDFEDDSRRDTYIPDPDPPSYDSGDDGGGWDDGGGFDD